MPARPGAFTANFAPETLNEFREKCKRSGLQYTKVLEELATLYLESDGKIIFDRHSLERSLAVANRHKKVVDAIIEHLESNNLLDAEQKKELELVMLGAENSIHQIKEVEKFKVSRQKNDALYNRLTDPSINRASPPDEITKWEDGYSDLFDKMKVIERGLWDKWRDTDRKYLRKIHNLQKQVDALQEQLSSIQAKITD